jgi:hypothetical protein
VLFKVEDARHSKKTRQYAAVLLRREHRVSGYPLRFKVPGAKVIEIRRTIYDVLDALGDRAMAERYGIDPEGEWWVES